MMARHGISLDEYETRFYKQEDHCGICEKHLLLDKDTHLDHDHSTGKLRGFLCVDCNKGLGRFKDNPSFLNNAILYLNNHDD